MIQRASIIILAALLGSCGSLDRVSTLAEFRDLTRTDALKIVPRLPKSAEHIYVKRVMISDSVILYLKYTVSSKDALLEFTDFISRKVKFVQSSTLPARWPRFSALPFAERPTWWDQCTGTPYYYEVTGGTRSSAGSRGEGAYCCIDEKKNEVSIWYWNMKDWNTPANR